MKSLSTNRSLYCSIHRLLPVFLLLILLAVLFFPQASAWDENVGATDALIIRFSPGVVSFPPQSDYGHNSFKLPLDDASFTNAAMETLFSQLDVISFETVAPEWRNMTEAEHYDRHGNRVDLVDFSNVYLLKFDVGLAFDIEEVMETLRDVSGIVYVECDRVGELFFTPDDSLYSDQWNLNNALQAWPDDAPCDSFIDINAPQAWDIWDSAGTRIAICDDGIMGTHEDLGPYIDRSLSKSFVPDSGWSTSGTGHGTHVAGVAAAGGDNDIGIAGVANFPPNHDGDSVLVALRIKKGGIEDLDEVSARAANAFSYLTSTTVDNQILVVNNSWGSGSFYKNCYSYGATLRDAFRNAFNKDISIVCAAGNGPTCVDAPCDPTNADTCFAYPAAFEDYSFAITGIKCDGDLLNGRYQGSYIDLTAPGKDILTTAGGADGYTSQYGTSLAAPHVAGAIALLLGRDPNLTNEDCYHLLEVTAGQLDGCAQIDCGHGLLKLDRALAAITYPGAVVRDSVIAYAADSIEARWQEFANVDGLNSARGETWEDFWVHVYKLEKIGDLWDADYASIDTVWARGRTSNGWKNLVKYDALFHANHTELVQWDAEDSKATFGTYTYLVFEDSTEVDTLGWFPKDPEDGIRMDYSVLLTFEVQGGGKSMEWTEESILHFGPERLPSTGHAILRLALGRPGVYTLDIYNVTGRRTRSLLDNEQLDTGTYQFAWDGKNDRGMKWRRGFSLLD